MVFLNLTRQEAKDLFIGAELVSVDGSKTATVSQIDDNFIVTHVMVDGIEEPAVEGFWSFLLTVMQVGLYFYSRLFPFIFP